MRWIELREKKRRFRSQSLMRLAAAAEEMSGRPGDTGARWCCKAMDAASLIPPGRFSALRRPGSRCRLGRPVPGAARARGRCRRWPSSVRSASLVGRKHTLFQEGKKAHSL